MHSPLRVMVGIVLIVAVSGCTAWSGAALYASGTRALDRGEPAQAVADLEQAARLLPESSEVQNHLGIAYGASGRPDAELAAYRRAVALDCSNEAAQINLKAAEAREAGRPLAATPSPGALRP
jgi:Flp pilus assembly protein TadD